MKILEWLQIFGRIEQENLDAIGVSYIFRAPCGLGTPFTFNESDQIVIPGFVWHIRADELAGPLDSLL